MKTKYANVDAAASKTRYQKNLNMARILAQKTPLEVPISMLLPVSLRVVLGLEVLHEMKDSAMRIPPINTPTSNILKNIAPLSD